MKKIVGSISFFLLMISFNSCKSQSNEQKIKVTGMKVVDAIRNNNASDFKSLIGVTNLRVIGKDDESIVNDVKRLNLLFKRYLSNSEVEMKLPSVFNNIGQMPLQISIIKKGGDSLGINEMHLNLYFGPPDIVPLNKISGYELVKNNSDSNLLIKK